MKHQPARETKLSDWGVINAYFDALLAAYNGGEISPEDFRDKVTDKIGYANNYGVDRLLETIENEKR